MPRVKVGTSETRLVVLRGNSASGKSSVAAGIRERFGRGLALVGQDNLRRIVLRERDRPGGANIGLIDTVARHSELREWYRRLDLLPGGVETVVCAQSGLDDTVDRIMRETGLAVLPAREH
ncbi:hypothetical protein EJ357_05805 [Streptomyces cyaneochromogenes]|uniref:Kinase n=1 Tax=Streptomyces cyaneochromogenes TaxID=2496836 RepID=A0A3Q9ELG2_9ACTN|nr:hypothetical protein [Streptomyces cyaneochromogenes]AZQ33018.1 hypothetical protein EJ357_05805 [Streptomyces cyaneochromogenes]